MTKYLITAVGFNNAVRLLATVITTTSIFSLVFARPNPEHSHPETEQWIKLETWVDTEVFKNKAFCWFMIAIAFLRFGYYAVLFNLKEWASALETAMTTSAPPFQKTPSKPSGSSAY
ncbi:uncharacterized protein K441DRAFT_651831 [Cenococcum geophilum 1.58]|uniref:uncharacterized protein n=1 Tax=Cenococcum geophilum 1.58 TaxID=794803 RepID=UPI00358F2047|nr:hypothetical protein K441DRAFT_651831 [Cenococcum geophilum 1.58]